MYLSILPSKPNASLQYIKIFTACCWWGRGAINTRGTCNLGKFNYYAGSVAQLNGRSALYPNIDFCQYPEAVCSSDNTNELRWTIAFFEWSERIQRYTDNTKWDYVNQLVKFVDDGMTDDSFIDSVSRVLTHNCDSEGCSSIDVRYADERRENFYMIINEIFDIASILESRVKPSPKITPQPTFRFGSEEALSEEPYSLMPQVSEEPYSLMPQVVPALAPSMEVIENPQPGPYEAPPVSYQTEETEMPTYLDTLVPLEGNGVCGRLLSPVIFLMFAGMALLLC
jgi:hypothetical protein